MATIHTAYGPGEVVEVEHGQMGKTRYKVAGYGFEMWLDATDPAIHTAGEDVFSYAPQVEMMQAAGRHVPGTPGEAPHFGGGHDGSDAWGMGHHEGSNVDFGDTDHSWDNSTTLPYKWEPKNPVEMYDHEQTISPDHDLGYTPEERTKSSDSVTGESRENEHEYPGPAPHLFAASWNDYDDDYDAPGTSDDFNSPHPGSPDFERQFGGEPRQPEHNHPPEQSKGCQWCDPHHHHATNVSHVAAHSDDVRAVSEAWPHKPDLKPLPWEEGGFGESMIAPEHQAKPGQPSWQDHVNADAERLQDQIGADTSNPAHPDHLPPPRHGSWQRPAGLSPKFADVHEAFNPNDPIDMFRLDPGAAISRHASFDRDAGLDPDVGQEQLLLPSNREILRTAAWRDVRDKAVRIVREGGVHVEAMDTNTIYANVDGDHSTYEVMILTGAAYPNGGFSGGKQAIANWKCDCDWGKWAFKRKFTFVGRLCSHGYAAYLTQASHNAKNDPNHGFRKRKKKSSVDDFKSWAKDENGGHIDRDAADNYLSSTEEPVTREDAEKILDYVETNHTEHPERDYDVKGYHYDNDTGVLQHQPGKLTPHVYETVERDEDKKHYFTDLGDDRKTTGPDQIQAKVAKGELSEHHPAFAWHSESKDDFPDEGIVHFSSLHLLADEDLLNRLRTMSEHGPAEHPHGAEGHNHEVSNVVDELHDRGYDAAPLVAMKRAALQLTADDDDFSHFMEDPVGAIGSQFSGTPYSAPDPTQGLGTSGTHDADGHPLAQGAPPPAPEAGQGSVLGIPKSVAGDGPGGSGGHTPNYNPATPAAASHPGGPGAPGGVNTPPGAGGSGGYTVKPGDNLTDIAQSHGTTVDNIVKANPGAVGGSGTNISQNADLIHPGDPLKGVGGGAGGAGNWGHTDTSFIGGGGAAPGAGSAINQAKGATPAGAPGLSKAPSPMPSSAPGAPAAPAKVGAQRFAELYFWGADESEPGEDDKKSATPSATPPTNQGVNYKQISQGDPQQARPQPQTSTGVASGGMSGEAGPANPLGAPPAGQAGPQHQPQQGGGLGGAGGAGLQQALGLAAPLMGQLPSLIGDIGNIGHGGLANMLSTGLSGLGGAMGGLGHLGAKEFAARYFQADGTFGGEGGGDWMDHSFAGSGPDRQNWSTTSESWLDEHEEGIRDETWVTDLDGDVATYTTKRPKQSRKRTADGGMLGGGDAGYGSTGGLPGGTLSTSGSGEGLGGSFEHAESSSGAPTMGTLSNTAGRTADWNQGQTGFHNPRNPSMPTGPSEGGGHGQPGQQQRKAPKKVLPPTNGAPPAPVPPIDEDDASSPERALSLMSSAYDTDGSDVVRMFQASGAGCVNTAAGIGGHSNDDIAANAAKMLRTAGRNYSLAEQRELEDEEPVGGRHARNFGDLDLTGTHYVD